MLVSTDIASLNRFQSVQDIYLYREIIDIPFVLRYAISSNTVRIQKTYTNANCSCVGKLWKVSLPIVPFYRMFYLQDTVVALQALSEFAELIYSKEVDMSIDISKSKGGIISPVKTILLTSESHDVLQYAEVSTHTLS